jgi:hypothetical protein
MKKMLVNFRGSVLAKNEMSSIKGGGACAICSEGTNGHHCSGYDHSLASAQSMVRDFYNMNDGYRYFRVCPEQ